MNMQHDLVDQLGSIARRSRSHYSRHSKSVCNNRDCFIATSRLLLSYEPEAAKERDQPKSKEACGYTRI